MFLEQERDVWNKHIAGLAEERNDMLKVVINSQGGFTEKPITGGTDKDSTNLLIMSGYVSHWGEVVTTRYILSSK